MSSFGESLKRERELRQISLREISEATKINLRYLDALEKNEFRHLPGGVFNKGFVRAFAQYIGIDPEAMVESYLEELRMQEARAQEKERGRRAGSEPRRATASGEGFPARRGLWMAVVAVLVLAAIVAAVVGIRAFRHRRVGAQPASPPSAGAEATGAIEQRPALGTEATGAIEQRPALGTEETGATKAPQTRPEPEPGKNTAEGTPVEQQVPSPSAESTVPAAEEASPEPTPASPGPPASPARDARDEGFAARIVVDRPVSGTIVCDGRLMFILESLPQGTPVEVHCREALVLDADDAGALRVGVDGAEPAHVGPPGTPLARHRIEAPTRKRDAAADTP